MHGDFAAAITIYFAAVVVKKEEYKFQKQNSFNDFKMVEYGKNTVFYNI